MIFRVEYTGLAAQHKAVNLGQVSAPVWGNFHSSSVKQSIKETLDYVETIFVFCKIILTLHN